MRVGMIGAGNTARAIARGWGGPVFCSDSGSGRAQALVDELGGRAFNDNAELADSVDLVVLCHKPAQLEPVAERVAGREVTSRGGSTARGLAALERAGVRAAFHDAIDGVVTGVMGNPR